MDMFKVKPVYERDIVEHPSFCSLPYTKLILNSWGTVSMCCHQVTQLGKLDENTDVLDIWNSDLAKEIRETTDRGELHPVCTSWNSCPYMVKEKEVGPIRMYKNAMYPTYLEICLPDTHCNIGGENPTEDNPACIMCRRNFEVTNTEDLTDFLCEKSKSLMPYLHNLCVLGIAEPFWKDAVFKIFDKVNFAQERDHIQFITNTNGTCLNENMARRFFDTVMWSDLAWSLDSATRETHIKIRRLDAFDLVVKNLKQWIEIRNEYGGAEHHMTSIYNNINIINVHEMVDMVEMAADIGVEKMFMLPTYDQAGVVKLGELLMGPKNVHIFKEYSDKAMARANDLGLELHYPKLFDVPPPKPKNLVSLTLSTK